MSGQGQSQNRQTRNGCATLGSSSQCASLQGLRWKPGAVVEVDDAVGEGFGGEEPEADGAVARLNQGDAFADEDGDDVDAELVDFALRPRRRGGKARV